MSTGQQSLSQQLFLPIEPLSEYNVSEIQYDGHEILEKPPNPSEHFQKIVNRIDFDEILDGNFDSENTDDSATPNSKSNIPKSGDPKIAIPFEKAKRSVFAGLTEVCALIDILAVAKEKHYMVVEPVHSELLEQKHEIALAGKKSALAKASSILLSGSDRFRRRVTEMADARTAKRSYHNDLLHLRHRFRLKMFANGILGDFSLRSIGSRYLEGGHFEVAELKDPDIFQQNIDLHCSRLLLAPEELFESYLTVEIMEEASQETLMSVILQDPRIISDDLISGSRLNSQTGNTEESGTPKICNQNLSLLYKVRRSLMMREVFYQLCQEVNQHGAHKPQALGVSVAQNNIVATLFPGIQVILKLVQSPREISSQPSDAPSSSSSSNQFSSVIAGLLSQLSVLYRHNQASSISVDNLWCDYVSLPPSVNSVRKKAGPLQLSNKQVGQLNDVVTQYSMLKTFLDHSRHYWLRQKVHECLNSLSQSSTDPAILFHWCITNSHRESCVVLELVTCGFEYLKTRISIIVHSQSLTLYLSETNSEIILGYDLSELQRILRYQIASHHLTTFRRVLQRSIWKCLASNVHSGIGSSHEFGTNPAVLLYSSPNNKRIFCVRGGNQPSGKIQFFLKLTEDGNNFDDLNTSDLLTKNWQHDKYNFREIDLTKINERSFVGKLETLVNVFIEL